AHLALAEMEKEGRSITLVTQNIDGLHQEAGSSSVIELHGTTRRFHCMDCSKGYSMDLAFQMSEETNPPVCSECEGILRPDVIFFGESLDPHILQQAYQAGDSCDFLLVVGSSLVVYPAADIPIRAKQGGAVLTIVNKEDTPLDYLADFLIHEEAGSILPKL
ncbi:NAD-dependent deacetylase, partial [Acidobacteriota bacterium]